MHISRIAVKNFRNFDELDLTALPSAHVVVGENRSGKSNLLYALRLVLDPSLPDSARILAAEDFWDGLAEPFGGNEIEVVVELTGFDGAPDASAILCDYLVGVSPAVARLTYLYRPNPATPGDPSPGDYEFLRYGGLRRDQRITNVVLRYVSLALLPALRDAESVLASARSPLRQLISRIDIDPTKLTAAGGLIERAGNTLLSDTNLSAINTGISDRVEEMVGQPFSIGTKLGISATDTDQLTRAIRLLIDDTKVRSIAQTSLGSANVLYLALLLELLAAQQAANEIAETVLAVEEPEAHLHPHLQRVLFRHLLGAGRPTIVTTHSPHLVSVAPLDSITMLRTDGTVTSAHHTRGLTLGATVRADLQRYLDVTRSEMLFAKGVILVEGAAEQFLMPVFAANAGFELDAYGVTVCAVHGTDFSPYRTLLASNGFQIVHVVITDGDPDDDGVPIGVHRGRDLIRGAELRTDVDALIDSGDFDEARRQLERTNVFVGEHTLELDLAHVARGAMVAAYEELHQGAVKRRNFARAIDESRDGDPDAAAKLLARIDETGKGRYAQRLAAHLDGVPAPSYIAAALAKLRSKLEP